MVMKRNKRGEEKLFVNAYAFSRKCFALARESLRSLSNYLPSPKNVLRLREKNAKFLEGTQNIYERTQKH